MYDYNSIMHYASKTFARNPYIDTIQVPSHVPEEKIQEMGQRIRLSPGDIQQTNLLYKCPMCGRTFQATSGKFSSPSFLKEKPPENGIHCEWRIQATHGEKIILNITNVDIAKSDDCSSNYIEVLDGYWHKSKSLRKFCGDDKNNETIVSSGSRLLVKYISKNPSGYEGFQGSYEAVCGGDLIVDSGHLESPNYPSEYQSNKRCVWKITVEEGFQVALHFQSFQVENHDKCFYDYVEVRDGLNFDSPLLGTFCGYSVPPVIRSTSNHLFIKFSSDESVGKSGFSANFFKEFDECKNIEHGCAQECINTLGSYRCSCRIGFELHSDGKNCEGAFRKLKSFLI